MKIKISSIQLGIVIIAALVQIDFFYLGFSINGLVLLLISIAGFFFSFIFSRKIMILLQAEFKFAFYYCLISVLSYLLITIYTIMKFPVQGLMGTLYSSYHYYSILLIFPLLCYLIYTNDIAKIYTVMNIAAVIWYMLVIMQKFLYETKGIIILSNIFVGNDIMMRNDNIRISLLVYGNLMIVYNFYKFYIENKVKNLIITGIGLFCLIYIQQTRMYSLTVLLCLLVIVILDKGNNELKLLKKLVMVGCVVLFITQTDIVSNFIGSFSEKGDYGGSTIARTYTIEYYWSYFIKNPLCGMGFANGEYYPDIVYGIKRIAALSDVGIIGQAVRLGIFVVPIYIVLIIRYAYILKKIKRYGKRQDYIFYFAFFLYILLSSGTLIMLDSVRIMLYPLSVAFFEFINYKMKLSKLEMKSGEQAL